VRTFSSILLLSTCCLSACAGILAGPDIELENAGRFIKEKRYNEALATYGRIVKQSRTSERGANALFASASARAFYDNPQKDYVLALREFDEFLRLYPNNEKARDAQNWRYFLETLLELKKENERLTTNIEQLKELDIRHEERRRK